MPQVSSFLRGVIRADTCLAAFVPWHLLIILWQYQLGSTETLLLYSWLLLMENEVSKFLLQNEMTTCF